jgi:hypothetical protein
LGSCSGIRIDEERDDEKTLSDICRWGITPRQLLKRLYKI